MSNEASPICRGQNLTLETVLMFIYAMPKTAMPKVDFNAFAERRMKGWTQTHSQIARQMALYFENEGICYPKFTNQVTVEQVTEYANYWARHYFVPNPYTPSLKGKKPTNIYAYLKSEILQGSFEFTKACNSIFNIELNNLDKVRVYLNSFTDLVIDNDIMSINEGLTADSQVPLHPVNEEVDAKTYYEMFGAKMLEDEIGDVRYFDNLPLQQIYYGAPGTGKSHEIKEQTAEAEEQGRVFRTTFHPDSDYSTFVGCYKPTISQKAVRNVAGDVVKRDGKEVFEDYISYQFVPQVFTNAYVKAWQTNGPVFLIIEEINRGNCAQIFGDLFQLLDRGDDGVSDYPIKADTDLCQYLEKELGEDGSKGIKDGKIRLPRNLHIWATMNTSDQSLFPIDSAFKRRWDWHYTPICNAKKGWKVEANGNQYDWWDFLQKINERIERATSSEDKQLGYFFCKADGNGVISAEKFVSKVIFYLWNDVFKDFADSSDDPFKVADGNRMTFRSFYIADENGKTIVNEDNVEALLGSLGVDFFSKTTSEEEIEEEDEFGDNSNKPKYSINGVGEIPQNRLAEECLREYIKLNPEQSVEEVLAKWKGLGNIVSHFVESKDEFDARTDSKKYRSTAVPCKDSVIYIANDGYSAKNGKTEMLLNAVNSKNWGIKVAKVVKVA